METKQRTIIVGDIHGCIEEFNELIRTLSYNKQTDRLILLGDLIDRGPDSVAVVRRAREMDLECVRGNHEQKFLKWFRNSGSRSDVYDRSPHYSKFSDQDINYIANMPLYIKVGNILIVHAGLRPGIPVDKQKPDDLMYLRYTDSDRKFISVKKVMSLGAEAAGAHFWTEFWTGPESVVYGHNVHSLNDPLIEKISDNETVCYGIDTGCCFGGRLTAMILENKEIVQVQAKKVYYKSYGAQ